MPNISVIVPIYNVEKYIAKCIYSIKKQTHKDFICFLISDGSKDKSIEIAREIVEDDERFVVIEKENGGYGSVLEYAINLIDTDYFIVCDPDDYLDKNCLEILYTKAIKDGLDIVTGARTNVFEDSEAKEYDSMFDVVTSLSNVIINNKDKRFNTFININPAPHSKLYRTNIAKKIVFEKNVSYTDNMLFYLSVINAKKVMYIDTPLYYYLINRSGNSMSEKEIKALKQHLIVFNSILNQCQNNDIDYVYFRLFQSFKEIFYRYGKLSVFDFDIYNGLNVFLSKLLDKREIINKYYDEYSNERFIAKIKDKFLLNRITSKYTFDSWLKKLGKK